MDLEKTLELMKKFGVRRLKTSDLELELDLAPPLLVEPKANALGPISPEGLENFFELQTKLTNTALGPISLPDEPTDEQLLLWSTPAYEGPTPGQSQEERLKVQAAAERLEENARKHLELHPLVEDAP